tara:strand:- start:4287 stop:4898 length:612 start_codon:yes stop_codon:yes gene_type:complete
MYTSTSFISKLQEHGGISKANKFLLKSVTLPTTNPKVANHFNTLDYNKSLEDMSYFCEATNFPGRNLATQSFRTGSVSREFVHSNNFNDTLTLTFNLTDDMFVKNFFDDWQELIMPLTNKKRNREYLTNNIQVYPKDYYGTVVICKLKKDLSTTSNNYEKEYMIQLHEAFPKQVNPINLSFSSNEVMKLQVVIAYSRWQRIYQ